MTKEEFESTFLTYYQQLCSFAERRVPTLGTDMVHQAYSNIIQHETYKNGKLQYARQWVTFKVRREITRHLQRVTSESLIVRQLRDEDYDHLGDDYEG